MAFAAITGGATTASASADQSSAFRGYTEAYAAGTLMLIYGALDNFQTTDGDEVAITSITDTVGNTYTKAKAFTNGQGTAQTGATVELWYSLITIGFAGSSANIFTANFSNATSRDATVIGYKGFSLGAGNTVAIEGTSATLANDAADPGSLNVTTSNIECLRVRVIAAETNSSTALTVTAGWTALPGGQTASGAAAANQALRGEFIISTATSAASDPTFTAVDNASVYVAFKEVAGAPAGPIPKRTKCVEQAVRRASYY